MGMVLSRGFGLADHQIISTLPVPSAWAFLLNLSSWETFGFNLH